MKKLLVVAIAVLIASPAFAAVQNVKVSGDIQTTFLDRQDFSLGLVGGGIPEGLVHQNLFAEQTRVRIDADLTDNVSATVRLINETAWGIGASDGDNGAVGENGLKSIDLDLAYVTLREFLYSPLTLTIGRQDFYFGNGLIIGGGPNNITSGHYNGIANDLSEITSEDGIKAVLDYKPLTLTMFYFKDSQGSSMLGGYKSNSDSDSSDVYGLNANYQLGDAYNTVLEAYLFSRINGSNITTQAGGTDVKGNKTYVPGLRASTNPVKGLNVQGELAWQLGNQVVSNGVSGQSESEHRGAMAAQLMASYALPVLEKYKPAVSASYTYLSGDKNGFTNYNADHVKSAKVYRAWDPMFEGQGGGTIYNSLFQLTDMHIFALGASVSPLQDVTAAFTWSSLVSAERLDGANGQAFLQPDIAGSGLLGYLQTPAGSKKTGLGNEYDVNFGYAYTEDVSFGLSLGWFVPGDVFKAGTNGMATKTASQAIADIRVAF